MIYKSVLGKDIELTPERKNHILLYHSDLKPYFSKVVKVLLEPSEIRISKSDAAVLLFYKHFAKILSGKYIVIAVKSNSRSFILTAYLSNRILSGEKYEPQK